MTEFAAALRQLRQQAGNPGYRELAGRAHYSSTTLSEAAAGRRLPTLVVTLAYVQACGGEVAEWEARWRAVATWVAAAREPEVPDATQAPYPGLAAFQPEDADRFVGREHLLAALVEQVAERRLIAVVGPSGSGKSSLLRAGLVARLAREDPSCVPVLLTPGADPLDECAVRLGGPAGVSAATVRADLAADPRAVRLLVRQVLDTVRSHGDVVLVVDQFEEVFTLCGDARERAGFIAVLLAAVDEPGSRTRVVLGVRADFLARCAESPDLATALRESIVLVGPMNAEETRRAIVQPATRAECVVESGLVATLVAEAAGHAGALPLLSHVLLEVWRRRRGNALTLAAYEAAGGMAGALERTAEAIYAELDERQRRSAQALFLRLIAPGEGTEDTKRRMPRHEVDLDDAELATVVDRFVRARLLLLTEDGIEISHEALIQGWPRLREWLAEDRDLLRAHRRLTDAAIEWDRHGRDDGLLYRGVRLLDWQGRRPDALNQLERRFLAAGRVLETRERGRSRRRTRLVLVSLISVLSLVSVLAGVALVQGRRAALERDLALSRQLALQAREQLVLDPEQALRLARRAFQVRPTAEAEAVLRQAVADARARTVFDDEGKRVLGVAFSPDGTWLACTDEDGVVRVWPWSGDGVAGSRPTVLRGHRGEAWSPVFSPDSRRLATAGVDGTIHVVDFQDGRQVVLRGHLDAVWTVAFSPDGQRLASASADGTVRIWDLTGSAATIVLRGHDGPAQGVAFSPDGRHVASSGHDHTVRLWDLDSPGAVVVLRGHEDATKGLAFSADGTRLISASIDGTARVWTLSGAAQPVVLRGHQGTVEGVAFSPDGTRVATTSDDNTIRVWNPANGANPLVLHGHLYTVWAVAFSPDGTRLVSASSDGTVRVWDPRGTGNPVTLRGHEGAVYIAAFTPDGRHVISGGHDHTVRVWNAATGTLERTLRGHDDEVLGLTVSTDGHQVATASRDGTIRVQRVDGDGPELVLRGHTGPVWTAAFSPDGRHVASASLDGTLRIWDTETGTALVRTADITQIRYTAFSPNGDTVATAGWDGTVRVWDTTGDTPPRILRGHHRLVWSVAFSPDGTHLVSAGSDGTVRLWDLTRTDPPQVWRGHQASAWYTAFSPDGQSVVTAGMDGTVRLWPTSTSGEPVTFTGFGASVESVAFSPNGQRLVTSHDDGTVRVWHCDACGPIEKVTAIADQLARTTS